MNGTTWKRAKQVFNEALEKSGPERRGFVASACGDDRELRAQVHALLAAHDEAGEFMASPTVPEANETARVAATVTASPPSERPGATIGHYKLLQVIGEGGFGVVYMAEQEEPVRRRVALKIIKLGMDTKQVIARFEAERQALALMEHPNIAKVLDAGSTETGRPYFVMELVKGVPIVEYCDSNRLTTRERLDLFTEVCGAVQHAHQKGIIHRDLKPSNVMVTLHDGKPVPKVIDFGIAKATSQRLTEKTLFTEYGQFIGTPVYMSPEQAEMSGLDVDTRSDIYSLGVLLYELLTGTTPFDVESLREAGFAEMQRMIREEEPPKPSTRLSTLGGALTDIAKHRKTDAGGLTRLVRGDLDWIVMKALEKDRTRRYASVSEFAADVGRHLGDELVSARPPSAAYRLRKYVKRHRGPVAAALGLFAALAAGFAVSTALYFKAEAARIAEAEQRARAQRRSYVANLAAADASVRFHEIAEAERRLEDCEPDLRGWEWWHLQSRLDESLATLIGHRETVYSVAISPDGTRIVSGSGDGSIRVWDAASGRALATFASGDDVLAVAFGRDGKRIVSGSGDGKVHVLDAVSGEPIATFEGHTGEGWVLSMAISPDGSRIASGSHDETIRVWDTSSGETLLTLSGHGRPVSSVAYSPDGTRIASASWGRTVLLWDAETGQLLKTLAGHTAGLFAVAFSPDGKRIISGSADRSIRVWDVTSGAELSRLDGHDSGVNSVAYSPDGARIVSTSHDSTVRVWSASSGELQRTLVGHRGGVASAVFSPDGHWIVSAASDGTLKRWDPDAEGSPSNLVGHESNSMVISVTISPDGSRIASGARDSTIRIWDAASGALLTSLVGDSWLTSVAFSPDGKRVVSGSWDDTVRVWDLASGEVVSSLEGPDDWVGSVAYSPDGTRIVSGSGKTIRIWDVASGEFLGSLVGHEGGIYSVIYSRDGKQIISGSEDGTVRIWNAASRESIATLAGHDHEIPSVAVSSDDTRIASASWDGTVRLWDATSGEILHVMRGDGRSASSVAFSPDGTRIVSGYANGVVKIWEAGTGEQLSTLRARDHVYSVAMSPDGRWIVAGVLDGTLRVWDTPPEYEPGRVSSGEGRRF